MRLDELIKNIQDTSLKHVLVNEFGEGDIYEYLNTGEHKYPCVFLTITGLSDVDYTREVNITLFYVDRLTSDQSNRKSIQSTATDVLGDIIHSLESSDVTYTLFTEKFSDLCAGAYAEFTVTVEYTAGCEQNFIVRTKKIENNGIYNVEDFDEVEVDVISVWEVPNGTNFSSSTWSSLPTGMDFSNVTSFYYMFQYCSYLTSIPQLDTSNGTDFISMFEGCSKLTSIPQLDTSNGTNFRSMFAGCSSLTEIPQLDTSNGTEFNGMFSDCSGLTTIPLIDTSKGMYFSTMFYKCSSLTTIPLIDTSKGTSFTYMFQYCSSLTSIPQLDVSKGTYFTSIFHSCSNLENITFVGSINYNIEFNYCTKLTYDSIKSILTACSNTTRPTTAKTLKFSRTIKDQNGELAALIATCNSKKWTISGLTLQ